MIRLILRIRHSNDASTQNSHRIRQIISKYSNKFRRVNAYRHGYIMTEKLFYFMEIYFEWTELNSFMMFLSNVSFIYCARAAQLFSHFIRKHFLVFFASSGFYWTCQIFTVDIFSMDYNNLKYIFRESHWVAANHASVFLWSTIRG